MAHTPGHGLSLFRSPPARLPQAWLLLSVGILLAPAQLFSDNGPDRGKTVMISRQSVLHT
jgi:hypothetical protein